MQALGLVFCFVLLIFIPLYNISNSEFLESFGFISKLINEKNGEKNRFRLLIYRWLVFIITCSFALITDKIEIILNLGGVLAIPLVSFYLPVNKKLMNVRLLLIFCIIKGIRKKEALLWLFMILLSSY